MSAPLTRERPILFSGPMVRALLDGHKTQTRRVVRLGYHGTFGVSTTPGYGYTFRGTARGGRSGGGSGLWQDYKAADLLKLCPYGVSGDRLWVREAWQFADWTDDGQPWIRYAADETVRFCEHAGQDESLADVWAHLSRPENYNIDRRAADRRWRPSIHMPRWASRLTLEITEVRVQRLQDISEEDARAEGVDWTAPQPFGEKWDDDDREDPREVGYGSGSFARDNFRRLWDSVNKERALFHENPWVFALTFKVLP